MPAIDRGLRKGSGLFLKSQVLRTLGRQKRQSHHGRRGRHGRHEPLPAPRAVGSRRLRTPRVRRAPRRRLRARRERRAKSRPARRQRARAEVPEVPEVPKAQRVPRARLSGRRPSGRARARASPQKASLSRTRTCRACRCYRGKASELPRREQLTIDERPPQLVFCDLTATLEFEARRSPSPKPEPRTCLRKRSSWQRQGKPHTSSALITGTALASDRQSCQSRTSRL